MSIRKNVNGNGGVGSPFSSPIHRPFRGNGEHPQARIPQDNELNAEAGAIKAMEQRNGGRPTGKTILNYEFLADPRNAGLLRTYWDPVLDCVDYIYVNAADQTLDNGGDATTIFAEAAAIGPHPTDTKDKRRRETAVSLINQMANKYLVTHQNVTNKIRNLDNDLFYQLCQNEILGLSVIEPIWNNPTVEEVWIDGPDRVRVSIRGGKEVVTSACFRDADHVLKFCESIMKQANRDDLHLDTKNPYVDARLKDLSRVAILSPDIAPGGPLVSIRRHPSDYFTMKQLVDWGTCSTEMWQDLGQWVAGKLSILVIGETGSGKTSFLDALSGLFPTRARIMTIEDVLELELNPNKPFLVPGCEKREPNKAGEGGFSIRNHVKASLRMAPDIVVIGEVRDQAAYDLVDAANTGHQVFSTLHANGADDAIVRLQNLISFSNKVSTTDVLPMIASAFDIIVYVERLIDGSHKVMSISEVASRAAKDPITGESSVATFPIWEFQQTGESPEGRIIGEFRKVNDLSEMTVRRHRLNFIPKPSWEDCLRLEGFEGKSTKINKR